MAMAPGCRSLWPTLSWSDCAELEGSCCLVRRTIYAMALQHALEVELEQRRRRVDDPRGMQDQERGTRPNRCS